MSNKTSPHHALPTRVAIMSILEKKVKDAAMKAEADTQIKLALQVLAFQHAHNIGDSANLVSTMEAMTLRLFSALYAERRTELRQRREFVKDLSKVLMEEIKTELQAAGFALPEAPSEGKVSSMRFG